MAEKPWKDYDMTVNGLEQKVRYNEDTVENLFLPLLDRLVSVWTEDERRIMVFIAAPPATGKSTLTQFLEHMARERDFPAKFKALGMDGFHYGTEYLESHFTERDGERIPLVKIKGAPETFDVDGLQLKIQAVRRGETKWPVYDRNIHDVIPDALSVTGDIFLLEGNWLLLKDERWTRIRIFADYSLLITAEPELLRERLIGRKIQGGVSPEEAAAFYETSDSLNVTRVLQDSGHADEIWEMSGDWDFAVKNG